MFYELQTIQYLSQMELSEVAVRIALDTVKQVRLGVSFFYRFLCTKNVPIKTKASVHRQFVNSF